MQDRKKDYQTNLTPLIKTLLVLAGLLFLFAPLSPLLFTNAATRFAESGQIGDTIGGLMSPFINLSAVIVTGLAFYMQYRANKLQVEIFTDQIKQTERQYKKEKIYQETQNKIQQFESQFFEMLRLHKENVDELCIISVINGKPVAKRQAFVTMADEFKTFLGYINYDHLPFIQEYKHAYDVFFWGWNSDYIDIDSLSHSWFRIVDGPNESDPSYSIDFRAYKGYSSSLGHYFRHLFLMVKFVAYSDAITDYNSKMKYLKILRAQLSNHEQILLFYNWLSEGYGGAWENEEHKFFTEYKMIHNLWVGELYHHQYIVDAVNSLIDKYNRNPKDTPLFEFQGNDFALKMKSMENRSLSDLF
ncbi:putative phage abortive infection protein [Longitalea luteola]|uniref:putative phage abortive infection protein n=1 Tax=Longitalea luteola TaxID=2812563 RepID=UPI001A96457C|nr:putative phage abortive infection protein [Longitalea luteola]